MNEREGGGQHVGGEEPDVAAGEPFILEQGNKRCLQKNR